jgi:protein-S-isoprenylcysteine O-methyltransferase Ste14
MILKWVLVTCAIAMVLLGVSGDWRSPFLWALVAGYSGIALYAIRTVSPDLARERFQPPEAGHDPVALLGIRVTALTTIVFSLLDSGRWHWSPPMSAPWRIAGVAAMLAGLFLFVYAMSVNRFFSAVVRIQTDRGHHVIDTGPYSRVRHPGYVGMFLVALTVPLALGSWWASVPGSLLVAFTLRRVWIEDRFLQANLPGYFAYTGRVRHRLVPGVW